MDFQFKPTKKYTIVKIAELAVCFRLEFIALEVDNSTGRTLARPKGKRKTLFLPPPEQFENQLIFEGHDLPFILDSETLRFSGNAYFNFVTDDPQTLREYLESKCLNPSPEKFAKIHYTSTIRDTPGDMPDSVLFEKPSSIF